MRWIERHTTWIGFALAFAGGVMVASFWMYRDAKNFWEILTAIGTLGAVFTAVCVPIAVRSRDRINAMRSSSVAAAIMQGRTFRMKRDVGNAVDFLEHFAENGPYEGYGNDAKAFLEILKSHVPWTIDEIGKLSDLPSDCAFNMARATGDFSEGVARFDGSIAFIESEHTAFAQRIAGEVAERLKPAEISFGEALIHIDAAVRREFH